MRSFNQPITAYYNGNLITIDEAERGSICYCPECGGRMMVRKGQQRRPHFAHYEKVDCGYSYQTALHYLAKDILENAKEFMIPEIKMPKPNYLEYQTLSVAKKIKIDSVKLEKKVDNIIPDIIVNSGGHSLFVEILVTHAVDFEKLAKIRKIGISTIEIDLSEIEGNISREQLSEILIEKVEHKTWLYSKLLETESKKALEKHMENLHRQQEKRKKSYEPKDISIGCMGDGVRHTLVVEFYVPTSKKFVWMINKNHDTFWDNKHYYGKDQDYRNWILFCSFYDEEEFNKIMDLIAHNFKTYRLDKRFSDDASFKIFIDLMNKRRRRISAIKRQRLEQK